MHRPVLFPALLMLATCAHAGAPGPVSRSAQFAPEVLEFLASVQREFTVETVLCLTGRHVGDTVHVEDVRLAGVRHHTATPYRVRFAGCSGPDVVGFAHNHPASACVFSETDYRTMRSERARVILVSCDGGFAWETEVGSGTLNLEGRDGRAVGRDRQ